MKKKPDMTDWDNSPKSERMFKNLRKYPEAPKDQPRPDGAEVEQPNICANKLSGDTYSSVIVCPVQMTSEGIIKIQKHWHCLNCGETVMGVVENKNKMLLAGSLVHVCAECKRRLK